MYRHGLVYDRQSRIVDKTTGHVEEEATCMSERHMAGEINSKTRDKFSATLKDEIQKLKCDQMILETAADLSKIRGVSLPHGKLPEQCNHRLYTTFAHR